MSAREIETAITAVRSAGKLLLDAASEFRGLRHKEDPSDFLDSRKGFVTEMDGRCEEVIKTILTAEFPDYGMIGEEHGHRNVEAENVWVVDPIDGTLSYAHGLDSYVTAIGLLHRGKAVLGVVFQPEKDELFSAQKGSGAFLNGNAIRVTKEEVVENSLVSMDHRIFRTNEYPQATSDLVKKLRRLRVSESCSQELCYVAAGKLDGFIRTLQAAHDYVMGMIIVEEAGGVVRDFAGQSIEIQINRERNTNLVAGNTRIVENLIEYLQTSTNHGRTS